MAAILKLRRGTSPSTTVAEPFFNTDSKTLQVGDGSSTVTLVRLGLNTGSIEFTGDITASNVNLSGDITIGGNIFLGDGVADNIVVSGEFSSSLIPNDNNEYDLGSTSKKWRHIYSVSASIDDISLPGSNIVSSSQQIADYNRFLEFNGDNVVSSSQQISNYGVFAELNGDNLLSSSQQIQSYNTFLEFKGDSVVSSSEQIQSYNTFLEFNGDNVVSSSQQISNYSTFLEINGDNVVSSSQQTLVHLYGTNIVSSSAQVSVVTNGTGIVSESAQVSAFNTFLEINGDNVVSSSTQITNLLPDGVVSSSQQVTDLLPDGVVSGSEQLESVFLEINGDNVVSSSQQISNYGVFAELNGDNLLSSSTDFSTYSASVDQKVESIHSYTSSLKTAISLNSDNVTILGNLTVQGTETTLNTNELVVEDKLIAVASGSTNSAAADGAGLFISGANKSITWDDTNSNIVINSRVSSSVGFKGDGSQLTDIQHGNVVFNGSGIISESQQLHTNLDARYLEINGDNVVSSSTQTIEHLFGTDIVSSSAQVSVVTNGTNIVSGSDQIAVVTNGTNIVSGSGQVLVVTGGTGIFSGSGQLPSGILSGSGQLPDGIVSQSSQVVAFLPDGVISGSGQLPDGIVSQSAQVVAFLPDGVISGSGQLPSGIFSGSGQLPDGIISSSAVGGVQGTIELNGSDVNIKDLQTSSSPSFNGVSLTSLPSVPDTEYTALFVSTSNEIGTRELATAAFYHVSSSINDGDPNVLGSAGAVKTYVDNKIIAASSGDITAVIPIVGGGLSGGGYTGDVSMSIDTGSSHFGDGVLNALTGSGIVSSSQQTLVHLYGTNIVSGSDQVSVVTNGNGIVSSSFFNDVDVNDFILFNGSNIQNFVDLDYDNSEHGNSTAIGARQSVYIFLDTNNSETGNQFGIYNNITTTDDPTDSDAIFLVTEGGDVTATSFKGTINATNGVVSGSSQVLDGSGVISGSVLRPNGDDVVSGSVLRPNGDDVVSGSVLRPNGEGIVSQSLLNDLTDGEVNQLKNINTVTITNTQWGYLGAFNQGLATTNNVTFNDLVVAGNLTVQGTETTLNTSELIVQDKLISVASGSTNSSEANGAGLHISGADESITWDHGNSRFNISDDTHIVGNLSATADVIAYQSSDERLKNNITKISGPLQKINAINGYTFDWDEEKQNIYKGRDYGVIAQEIERVAPELVNTRDNGYKAVKYEKLVPILIESIKELKREIDELKKSK